MSISPIIVSLTKIQSIGAIDSAIRYIEEIIVNRPPGYKDLNPAEVRSLIEILADLVEHRDTISEMIVRLNGPSIS